MKELITRLEIIRKKLDLNQGEFAELGDIQRTRYVNWLHGTAQPTAAFIYYLKQRSKIDIDLEWLFTGNSTLKFKEPLEEYKKTDCEEKLALARQLIETQNTTINMLQHQVSASVTEKPKNELQYS